MGRFCIRKNNYFESLGLQNHVQNNWSTVRVQSRTKHLAYAEDAMEGFRQAPKRKLICGLLLSKGNNEAI